MTKKYILRDRAVEPKAAGTNNNPNPNTIKVGLDRHLAFDVAAVQYGHSNPKPPRRFKGNEFLYWVEKHLKQGDTVHIAYEACGLGFGLSRDLTKLGADCKVIHPIDLDEKHTRVKTNGRDALAICQRLGRYLDGNKNELTIVRVPTEEEELARGVHRTREQLVRERMRLEAQGCSALRMHSQPAPSKWWRKAAWKTLQKVVDSKYLEELVFHRELLNTLDKQIEALTKKIRQAAKRKLPKGLGGLTSVLITREVCDWNRFKNRHQVGGYTGLCPSEYSTGSKRTQGSVTKHGNPRLRRALVELAWRMVRFQPGYWGLKDHLCVLAKKAEATSSQRKKAIVAVARRLAIDLWRLNTGQTTPEDLGLTVS